jgi:hypothetical protein
VDNTAQPVGAVPHAPPRRPALRWTLTGDFELMNYNHKLTGWAKLRQMIQVRLVLFTISKPVWRLNENTRWKQFRRVEDLEDPRATYYACEALDEYERLEINDRRR